MKEKEGVKSYDTLSDLYKDEKVGTPIQQDSNFTIHRMEEVHGIPVTSPIFRANYYSFVLVKRGKSYYTIDEKKFFTRPNTLYFTNPGHLKSFGIEQVVHGFLITTREEYLKKYVHQEVFKEFSFLLTEIVPPCFLSSQKFEELASLAEQILLEARKDSPLKDKIISSLFMVFLLKVKEYLLADTSFKIAYDRDSQIVQQFRKDLEKTFRQETVRSKEVQVGIFAELQQLNPSYFSTVIKVKTGKSANKWIQDKLIIEAKALLSGSQLSIKEIAYKLGFSEPTHFTKFFKRNAGSTPNQYRSA
ncbi:MAG: AraC family transcriptional regulator [Bacteroidota bacterium]